MIQSPCNAICRIDTRAQWCVGCGRTLAEIAGWGGADDQWRAQVVALAQRRLARVSKGRAP